MRKQLARTTKEALMAVLPITLIVFALSITIMPMPVGTIVLFLVGAVLLVLGMGLFTMGADMSLVRIGEDIGTKTTQTKKIVLIAGITFALGVIITIAEPDLMVLAQLVPGIPNSTMILTVAGGIGLFVMLAVLRILFRIRLSNMLFFCYAVTFALSFFVPREFVAVAFDAGGVATGPITVPFVMALGLGIASIRSDKDSADDSFGLVSLSMIGPIIAVMILGIVYNPQGGASELAHIPEVATTMDVSMVVLHHLPEHFQEVASSLWPILAVLLLFQLLTHRYRRRQIARIVVGFLYTFAGLVLFLTGVNVGFIPVGQSLGTTLANSSLAWFLVPLGAVIGYFIVAAEPAVHVLKKQVEEVTGGAIPGAAVQRYLAIAMAAALSLSMLRVLTGISLYYFLIPGYAIALGMTFFVPRIFVGIAFDSGGAVSGPMTSTFLLPLTIGACVDPSRAMIDAFGVVAIAAMTPLITLQLMGVTYQKKQREAQRVEQAKDALALGQSEDDVLEFGESEKQAEVQKTKQAFQDDSRTQEPKGNKPVRYDDDEILEFETEEERP